MAVALVHEQDVVHLVLNVERMLGDGLIQREGVARHVGVGHGLLRRKSIHGVEGQDLLQEI